MTDLTGPLATAASLAGRPVHVWTTADPTPPVETSNRKEAHATA